MNEVCYDVEIEPSSSQFKQKFLHTKPKALITTRERTSKQRDSGKLDSLWFFPCQNIQPARILCPKTIKNTYSDHEQHKKLQYETALSKLKTILSILWFLACTGGAGHSPSKVMKWLAEKIADKKNKQYSDTINFISTKVNCALLKAVSYVSWDVERSRSHTEPPVFYVCNC